MPSHSFIFLRLIPFYVLVASTLALTACHKADDSPSIDFGANDGISNRDASGMKNGSQDPTDWTSDATWNAQERALFSELTNGFLSIDLEGVQQPSLFDYTYVYPNPATKARWQFQTKSVPGSLTVSYFVKAVLVDKHYQVISRLGPNSFPSGYAAELDYAQLGMHSGELYRLYYVCYNSNGLLYKGHGDIRYTN